MHRTFSNQRPDPILEIVKDQARIVTAEAIKLVGLQGKSPSGWETLSQSVSSGGVKVQVEMYSDGTNWGWDDVEKVTIEHQLGTIRIAHSYPGGLYAVMMDNTNFYNKDGDLCEALNVVLEAAVLIRSFP